MLRVMKRSVNEIHGMVLKAGRGAGLPLGCAEDLANATAHLARRSPQHLGEVLMALEAPHEAPAMTRELVNARVATAVPVAIDHVMITEQPIRFSGIDAPHLLRSYVECAASLRAVSLALSTDNVLSLGGPAAERFRMGHLESL